MRRRTEVPISTTAAGRRSPARREAPTRARTRLRVITVLLAVAATVLGFAPAAFASYAVQPVGPSWVPNGGVHAVATDGSTVYVGGSFTGGVAALDGTTGALKWLGNANGDVRALALNGSHLLLGGAFTTVGGATHRKLASVDAATGAVDSTFKPTVGGTVRDIVVVNGNAYFGGQFTNLGAIDATTGTAVAGFTFSTNGQVYALGTDGARLYIGGKFTAVNGQTRNTLASVTLSTNTLDAWAPAAGCAITNCNVIWDMAVDVPRHRVYTVGRNPGTLYTVDTATANTATPAVIFRAPGAFNGDSQAVTLAPDGHVYVGGHYVKVTIKGVAYTRMLVSEWDVSGSTPVLQPFSTRFVTSYPGVWALASTANRLYVGGDFTAAGDKVNGQNKYPYFAMFPAAGSTGGGGGDTTPPTVTATSPGTNAIGVATTTDVTATFSESVQNVPGNFTLKDAGGNAVPASVTYDDPSRTATLHPTSALAGGVTYTATLTSGITDTSNNALAEATWRFTTAAVVGGGGTGTGPTVTAAAPASGANSVGLAANVVVTFDKAVQNVDGTTFTVTSAGGAAVTGAFSHNSAGTKWTFNPGVNFVKDTVYTVSLGAGITDTSNNAMTPVSWSFLTGPAPTVTGHVPASNATSVSRTAALTVTFSESVQNVTDRTITLTGPSGPVTVVVTPSGTEHKKWIVTPSSSLAAATKYTARVVGGTSGVTDLVGNPLAADVTWSFTTA